MKLLIYSSTILLIILGFTYQRSNTQKGFFSLNFEESLRNVKNLKLSQVAENVEYIQLQTNEECLINPEARYFFDDSLIFVTNKDHILKFSNSGKFLRKIGKPGRGPGEITSIYDLSIIPSKRMIYIQDGPSLTNYTFDGKFIRKVKIPYGGIVKILNDGKMIIWDRSPYQDRKLTFLLTNERGDTLSYIANYSPLSIKPSISASPSPPFFPEHFYQYNNKFFLKDESNDTVYMVSGNKILPAYFINLGKYKLPNELRTAVTTVSSMTTYLEKAPNYYFSTCFETTKYTFLSTYSYVKYIPKYILLNKVTGISNLLINDKKNSSGFVNDFDNGCDFWPQGKINNSKVFMPINVQELQDIIKQNKITKRQVLFPDDQKNLEGLIDKLDVLDNPILMIVTLK